MQRFHHQIRQDLAALLAALNTVTEKYSRKDYDTDTALRALLDRVNADYKDKGLPDRESQLQLLRAEWSAAEKGLDPCTLEKVTVRRGEMKQSAMLKVLRGLETVLREDYTASRSKLEEAAAMIGQIIVAGFQEGLIDDKMLLSVNTETEYLRLWKTLGTDRNIALGQKRVLTMVSLPDVFLLLEEVVPPMVQGVAKL
ncbi:hypothetical protein ACQKLP_13865 [Chitinophaga sp. NPDC101104]|uniref:hypothetical protein n=1 Tax=Chitinophaga sp. NPDC101104 TaxID=3390561 RepID=UPI003D01D9EB